MFVLIATIAYFVAWLLVASWFLFATGLFENIFIDPVRRLIQSIRKDE